MSLSTNPLTVLLTPPNKSPIGSEGKEKFIGAAAFGGANTDNRLRAGETAGAGAGETAGAGAGGQGAGGAAL